MYQLVLVALVLCILFKILNVNNSPSKSLFYCANAKLLEEILKNTPSLAEPYFPTRLWGFSGHIQTIIQGTLSRIYAPLINGKRYFFLQPDGATVTYDLYQPLEPHRLNGDYTLVICPGICNTSESVYIRRVVHEAQLHGYRVAVLNHLGALRNVPITSPRVFRYGDTEDFDGLVQDLGKRYPGSRLICVGFSMGGNIVAKYLGEEKEKSDNVVAGITACQGYDVVLASKYLLQWENFRRLYLFAMTENKRLILRHWQKQLFPEDLKREKGIVEREVWSAATLFELDDAYTRKLANCDTVEEYYRKSSCAPFLKGIKVPLVCINSADDPIVPPPLLEVIKKAATTQNNIIYVEQKYGGHLGFFQGGFMIPNRLTWLDQNVVNLADALSLYAHSGKEKLSPPISEDEGDHEDRNPQATFPKEISPTTLRAKTIVRPSYICKRRHIRVKKKATFSTAAHC